VSRIADWHCFCCGESWSNTGCIRGPTCDCGIDDDSWMANLLGSVETCMRCRKCHRHCQCREGFLTVDESIRQKLAAAGEQIP
jgi:hypothetical protein